MKKNEKPLIIFIAGATGSGKSELAVWLAKQISQIYENKNSNIMNKKICGAEIINADSRQVYKKLNVGSGKINKLGQKGIKHHLLDIASPKKNFSLGRWLKLSNKSIKEILRKNKIPIFCGGTNLYLRALNEGWVLPEVKQDYNLRRQL